MNSKNIGNIGEAHVLAELVDLHIPVYLQFGDNESADYIILVNNYPLKAQVKTSTSYDGEKTKFYTISSTSHRKNGCKHKYSQQEVDVFLCYDIQTKKTFVYENDGNTSSIVFRYKTSKNNQVTNVHMAEDFVLSVETLQRVSKTVQYRQDKDKVQTTNT